MGDMSSRTMTSSSGSTPYSRLRWYPRRLSFSVRMDRGINSDVIR